MHHDQLTILMSTYYHEDFDGLWETLDRFIGHSTADDLKALVAEINALLDTITDDHDLDAYLEELGNYADLGEDPSAYRTWLQEIARRVAAA